MNWKSIIVACFEKLGWIETAQLSVMQVRDMPERDVLRSNIVLLVGDRNAPKWATFSCPCGCGAPLLLSLSKQKRPRWSVSQNWFGRPDISPSIRRTDGCLSHFWIRKGNVEWCPDTGK